MIKVSAININEEDAINKVINSLTKKRLFGFMKPIQLDGVDAFNIRIFYFPFYVALTENVVHSKVLKDTKYNLMFGVEGYTGETGITIGVPSVLDRDEKDIKDGTILYPRIGEEAAKEKIVKCAISYIMRKNRHVPTTRILQMDTVWKPTYAIPIQYTDRGNKKAMMRFVDAESGYTVYRYDLIWKEIVGMLT